MGKKAYHMEIAQKYPQLVKQVFDLPSIEYATIKIGGIKDEVDIDTIIEYYIPFAEGDGQCHT